MSWPFKNPEPKKPKHILPEEFFEHDCKQGEESGCAVCVEWFEQKERERSAVNAAMLSLEIAGRTN